MNKKNIALVALAVLVITNIQAQQVTNIVVQPQGVYAEIRIDDQNRTMKQLYDVKTRNATVDTIFNNIGHYNPPVMYLFSQALFLNGEKESAIEWYLYAQLQAMYDANLCADNTAKQAVLILEENSRPVLGEFLKMNKKMVKDAVVKIVALFSELPTDYDRRWINLHGMDSFAGAFGDTITTTPKLSAEAEMWPKIKERTIREFRKMHK